MAPSPRTQFADRHIGPDDQEIAEMLATIGVSSLDELLDQAVPSTIREPNPLTIGAPLSETATIERLRELADQNQVFTSLIGTGYSATITPPVIRRNLLENPAWYTAYTPYQPEISQGRLEALFNFQTVVTDLTGLDLANASMLDEATAAAEAMTLLHRVGRTTANTFLVDADCHPQTRAVIETRADPLGIAVGTIDLDTPPDDLDDVFGALLQYPGSSGQVRDLRPAIDRLHDIGAGVAVATDLLALTLLTPPGELGADVAVGSAQRFGVPMGNGGPHAGFLATRTEHRRSLPGR
ncbi:MAG: glycine dehydrogenase (aminomethyl-transferring), partial [Acidimicrobiales bacterium]